MKKSFWLIYDLGIDGDFDGLFEWLDKAHAIECGENAAYFSIDLGDSSDYPQEVFQQIKTATKLRKNRDRLYLIWMNGKKISGRFVFGGRRNRMPWEGKFNPSTQPVTDEGED